nr:hypothetical protein [uncultured Marinifilum sp.]
MYTKSSPEYCVNGYYVINDIAYVSISNFKKMIIKYHNNYERNAKVIHRFNLTNNKDCNHMDAKKIIQMFPYISTYDSEGENQNNIVLLFPMNNLFTFYNIPVGIKAKLIART